MQRFMKHHQLPASYPSPRFVSPRTGMLRLGSCPHGPECNKLKNRLIMTERMQRFMKHHQLPVSYPSPRFVSPRTGMQQVKKID